jgi:hypothetical protein
MVIQCPIADIRAISRNTKGVRLIKLEEGDKVAAIARLGEKENGNGDESDKPDIVPDEKSNA